MHSEFRRSSRVLRSRRINACRTPRKQRAASLTFQQSICRNDLPYSYGYGYGSLYGMNGDV